MKHPWFLCLHIVVFCVIPQFISAQIEMPLRADTSKECSICHYRWLFPLSSGNTGKPPSLPSRKIP